jgi:hypothetical protein
MNQIKAMIDTEYRAHTSIANSDLSYILQGQHHFLHYKQQGSHSTPAMLIGTTYHHNVLEPAEQMKGITSDTKFIEEHPELLKNGKISRNAKAYQEWKKMTLALGDEIVKDEDIKIIAEMTASSQAHPWLAKMLAHPTGTNEKAFFFELYGVPCKAKLDHFHEEELCNIVIDLKSTEDCSIDNIMKSINKYHYYRQDAFYSEAATAQNGKPTLYYFAFQEKTYPFGMRVVQLGTKYKEVGNREIAVALEKYKNFPAEPVKYPYGDSFEVLSCPNWLSREEEN